MESKDTRYGGTGHYSLPGKNRLESVLVTADKVTSGATAEQHISLSF